MTQQIQAKPTTHKTPPIIVYKVRKNFVSQTARKKKKKTPTILDSSRLKRKNPKKKGFHFSPKDCNLSIQSEKHKAFISDCQENEHKKPKDNMHEREREGGAQSSASSS